MKPCLGSIYITNLCETDFNIDIIIMVQWLYVCVQLPESIDRFFVKCAIRQIFGPAKQYIA